MPTGSTGSGIANNPTCGLVDNTARRRFLISATGIGMMEIDPGDHLMTEQHFALRISIGHGPQRDRQAPQGGTQAQLVTMITHPTIALHLTHLQPGWIFDGWQSFGKGDWADTVAAGRGVQVERVVRPLPIIAVAKVIKFALAVLKAGEVEVTQELEIQAAMEAFVLALGLRMVSAAMTDLDTEAHQPQANEF